MNRKLYVGEHVIYNKEGKEICSNIKENVKYIKKGNKTIKIIEPIPNGINTLKEYEKMMSEEFLVGIGSRSGDKIFKKVKQDD